MKIVIGVPSRSKALHRLYPMASKGKYQLHRGDVTAKERKKGGNFKLVDTIEEAIDLINKGWHPRMKNIETGGAPDIISPERIKVLEFPNE
ncbi:hypothetical protein [Rhodovulum adriaticum]|uniref:Uncharacterized protein n=1 Tax=Rhodovulum adriaticum TaxID=35804 RepID=A0A4R2NHZ6_RHOAD|nr:hypothetical protein [Rhodovulum adriaticum]MBK1635817.1 hypothetical protein [Rhodovulum adriaticum]TCP21017.1 hypothetical protein EV656_11435 [Rhodovulum adriaticum]